MKLNTNAGPRTNRNILRRGGTIPDPRGGRFWIGATRVWEAEATGCHGRGLTIRVMTKAGRDWLESRQDALPVDAA